MGLIPGGTKTKLTWLVTALVIVWIGGPGGGVQGEPTVATAAAASAAGPGVDVIPRSVSGARTESAPGIRAWLEVDVVRGRTAEHEGVRLGVLAVVDEPLPAGPKAGGPERSVSIYVALSNSSRDPITYTALDLELIDGDARHAAIEARPGSAPAFAYGVLAPGEGASGWRVFRVPAGAGPFRLALALD